ncbi:MAG TPA: efflux RND transporter periplasmic adaptor subunit [Vicinamibacterales bacterium]|nr:efflux RND transporter periplasmic adaptor subunit [Vicinamibacterales bacterium]
MSRRPSVVFAVAVIVSSSLFIAGCGASSTAAEAAPDPTAPAGAVLDVPVVTATAGTIESALEISGTLAPRTRVAVRPKLPGTLERVLVDIGDRVSIGQTIATIDRREIDAQADAAVAAVAVASAALESAEANLANALLESDRAKNLFDKGALPRQRLDGAQTAYRAAIAQRDLAAANRAQADAALRRAREVQRDATVTSPVNGFVVERHYDAGAMPTDKPIVVVADLHQMKLEAGVSELEAGRLRVGMKALVSVQARPGETFPGQLAAIAPEVDERNRHFKIDVRVANDGRTLLSGMYASARIVEATTPNAILIPKEAVVTRDGKRGVQKVMGDTLTFVEITEGTTDGTRVQVVRGLAAGDLVLADARRQIASGAKVRAITENRP